MKLYSFEHSPNSRRVRMVLAEKQVELPVEQVNLMAGEHFSDAFKAISPRAILPALVTDEGETITETVAIMYYLEQVYPQHPLFGESPLDKARVMMWENRASCEAFGACEDLVRNSMEAFAGRAKPGLAATEQIPALAERGKTRLLGFYAEADAELAGRSFLAGESFSAADITLLSVVDFVAGFAQVSVPESLTNLARWHAAVSARPSAKA